MCAHSLFPPYFSPVLLFTCPPNRAVEAYKYEPPPAEYPLTCRLVCLGGDADDAAPRSDLEHWAGFTRGDFHLRTFAGGHFFLKDEGEAEVLCFLSELLAR